MVKRHGGVNPLRAVKKKRAKKMNKVILSLMIFCFSISCDKNPSEKISIKYRNLEDTNMMHVIISEYESDSIRHITESYDIIFRFKDNSGTVNDSIHYVDSLYYADYYGLFRKLNSITINSADGIVGHFLDFLWLSTYTYEGGKDTLVTYGDRLYLKRKFIDNPDILPNYEVSFVKKEFDAVFKDTVRTFVFETTNSIDLKETRSYDTQFNLVRMMLENIRGDRNSFEILKDDYERLKTFRKNRKPIFQD